MKQLQTLFEHCANYDLEGIATKRIDRLVRERAIKVWPKTKYPQWRRDNVERHCCLDQTPTSAGLRAAFLSANSRR